MDRRKVRLGMRVRVSGDKTSQVYIVEKFISPYVVHLVYITSGRQVSGGDMDVSILTPAGY